MRQRSPRSSRRCAHGEVVRSEIWQARRAFADRDVAVAEDLLRQDQEVNQLQRDIFQWRLLWRRIDRREWRCA